MPFNPENKELLNFLLLQDRKMSLLFSKMSDELGQVLSKYKFKGKKNPWIGNLALQKKFDKVLAKYRRLLLQTIRSSQLQAWNLSDTHNEKMIKEYLKGTEADLTRYVGRNLEGFRAFQKRARGGIKLSSRVFKLTSTTKRQLEAFISEGLTEGRSAAKLAGDLKQFLKEPNKRFRRIRDPKTGKLILSDAAKNYHPGRGVYRSSYKNALRLARNENNIAYRSSDQSRREKLPFVTGIKVQLSAAHPQYDICDELVGEYPKNFTFLGWHPQCLCFTTSVLLPKKDLAKVLNGQPFPESKKVNGIPKRAKNYLNKNADKIKKRSSTPYFISDNFKPTKEGFDLKK